MNELQVLQLGQSCFDRRNGITRCKFLAQTLPGLRGSAQAADDVAYQVIRLEQARAGYMKQIVPALYRNFVQVVLDEFERCSHGFCSAGATEGASLNVWCSQPFHSGGTLEASARPL